MSTLHPYIRAAQRSYTQHAGLIRAVIVRTVQRHALRHGYAIPRQDLADRVDDGSARSWELYQRYRAESVLSGVGTLEEQIAERDRAAAIRAGRSAGRRVAGRPVRPLGSEVPQGYRDALDRGVRDAHPIPDYVRQLVAQDDEDSVPWHMIPESLRGTAEGLALGCTMEDLAGMEGVSVRALQQRKSRLRVALGLANLERGLRAGIDTVC